MLSSDILKQLSQSTAPGAGVQAWMVTPVVNFLATSSGTVLRAIDGSPAVFAAGYFLSFGIRYVVTAIDGTITTTNTDNLGNNVAKNNVLTSGVHITAVNFNQSFTTGVPAFAASVAPVAAGILQVLTTAGTSFKWDNTVAAVPNTATICRGRIYLAGIWIPAP